MQEIIVTQYMGIKLFEKYTHLFCGFILTVLLFGEKLCHIQQKSPDNIPKISRYPLTSFYGGPPLLSWGGQIVQIAPYVICRICTDQIQFCTVAMCKLQP